MTASFDALDAQVVRAALDDRADLFRLDFLDACESTNSVALERAGYGAPAGLVVASETQTAGRGRRGRTWHSLAGASLTFSLLWRFPPALPLGGLSLAVGVALARALEGQGAAGIMLKWPNDVLADGRKLAGILIEMVPNTPGATVIGIGLNVQLPRALAARIAAEAIGLADLLPFAPSRNLLLGAVLKELAAVLARFEADGFPALREDWLARHAYAGAEVRLSHDGVIVAQGRCVDVDQDGALLLHTDRGVQRIVSGEVSLRAR
ncbi:MAG: biotin--[acetyl-CoA-carboxylase] ligase [Pseudomonadota bacterium]